MAGNKIADFFAEIGIKVDAKTLEKLDKKIDDLERSMHNLEVAAKKMAKGVDQPFKSLEKAVKESNKTLSQSRSEYEKFWKANYSTAKQYSDKISKIQNRHSINAKKRDLIASFQKVRNGGRLQIGSGVVRGDLSHLDGGKESTESFRKKQQQFYDNLFKAGNVISNNSKDWNKKFKEAMKGFEPPKNLTNAARKRQQEMYESLFPKEVDPRVQKLKDDIRGRVGKNVPAAGRFGNLAFAESRLAKERAEASAKAAKSEKERQKYLKKAQEEHLKSIKRIEREEARGIRELDRQRREAENRRRQAERDHHTEVMRNLRAERQQLSNRLLERRLNAQPSSGSGGGGNVGRPPRGMLGGAAFGGALGSATSNIAGFLPGFGAAYTIMNANRINQELQGQRLAMTAVMAGANPGVSNERAAELGAEKQEWLRSLANNVGFDFRETQPAFTKMMASGTSAGMSVDGVQNIFQGVSEYGRVMGLDSESMKGSMRAIEQMLNKGQVMSEELKLQLAERMPGVISAMAEAGGYEDQAALFKAMEKGEVKAKDVLEKFAKILSDRARAGGALEEAMNTSTAQQMRFNNAVTKLVEEMGNNGLETGMARIFKTFNEGLTESSGLGETLGKLMARLSWAIKGVVGGVRVLGEGFTILANKLGISRDGLAAIAIAAGMVLLPFGKIVLVTTALLMVLDDLKRWADGKDSFFKDLFNGLDKQTQEQLTGIATSVGELFTNLSKVGGMVFKGWGHIFEFFSESGGSNFILRRIQDMIDALNNLLEAIDKAGKADYKGAVGSLETMAKPRMEKSYDANTIGIFEFIGDYISTNPSRLLDPAGIFSGDSGKDVMNNKVDKMMQGPVAPSSNKLEQNNNVEIHIHGSDPEANAKAVEDKLSTLFNITSTNFSEMNA